MIVFMLERWLKGKVNSYAVPLVVLGGRLRDLVPQHHGMPACTSEELELAKSMADGMTASLAQ